MRAQQFTSEELQLVENEGGAEQWTVDISPTYVRVSHLSLQTACDVRFDFVWRLHNVVYSKPTHTRMHTHSLKAVLHPVSTSSESSEIWLLRVRTKKEQEHNYSNLFSCTNAPQ